MEKVSAADLVEYDQRGFFNNGIQYYAAARMLFFARGAPVTGNLAHHAVEMLLKGALCLVVPLTALAKPREFGHLSDAAVGAVQDRAELCYARPLR